MGDLSPQSDAGGQDWLGPGKETRTPLLPAQTALAGVSCPLALSPWAVAGNATLSLGRLSLAGSTGC